MNISEYCKKPERRFSALFAVVCGVYFIVYDIQTERLYASYYD